MNFPEFKTTVLLSYAFRPLFLLLVIQALVHIPLWYLMWQGYLAIDWPVNPALWHGHEMLSGFAGAAIGGFLLTAVATWTGRKAVSGWPLVLLCLFWLFGRGSLIFPLAAATASIAYWLGLLVLMAREVVLAGNKRNYKVVLIILIFLLLESAFQYAFLNQADWLREIVWIQLWLIVLLINLIGGRIIPAFTRNWLKLHRPALTDRQLPRPFGKVDLIASFTLPVFAILSLIQVAESLLIASALTAAFFQIWRLLRWQGLRAIADPLVWMMHLAYAWIPLGILLFASGLTDILPLSTGVHALGIGTVASMIVSVASRAALGHTNRPLVAHPLLTSAIILISLAAVFRILASTSANNLFLSSATILWSIAFAAFAIRYVPILLFPATDNSDEH
ncbi:MAG: NnrS family protein [Pseudomonadales bacterium]|nr:NnrS family protein [Pseudomonadales bacterium]